MYSDLTHTASAILQAHSQKTLETAVDGNGGVGQKEHPATVEEDVMSGG